MSAMRGEARPYAFVRLLRESFDLRPLKPDVARRLAARIAVALA